MVCAGTLNANFWLGPAMFEFNGTSRGQPPWYVWRTRQVTPLSKEIEAWQLPPLWAASAPSPVGVTCPRILNKSAGFRVKGGDGKGERTQTTQESRLPRIESVSGRPRIACEGPCRGNLRRSRRGGRCRHCRWGPLAAR